MNTAPFFWLIAAVGFLVLEGCTFNMTSIWFAIGAAAALISCLFTDLFRVQALLFITLCRCAGIPARWQSGLFVTPDDTGYFSILINNGRIIGKNLKRMGRDERWLQKQLQQRGVQSVQDGYLLMCSDAGQIYFAAKEPI